MDNKKLLHNLANSNDSSLLTQSIESLKTNLESRKELEFFKANLEELILAIHKIIDSSNQVTLIATQFMIILIQVFQTNLNSIITPVLIKVSINLGHPESVQRKYSHQLLLHYVKFTGNFGLVMKVFMQMMDHSSEQVRQKSINSFQSIFLHEQSKFDWKNQTNPKYTVKLINKLFDESQVVVKATEQTLCSMIKDEGPDHQNVVNQFRTKLKISIFDIGDPVQPSNVVSDQVDGSNLHLSDYDKPYKKENYQTVQPNLDNDFKKNQKDDIQSQSKNSTKNITITTSMNDKPNNSNSNSNNDIIKKSSSKQFMQFNMIPTTMFQEITNYLVQMKSEKNKTDFNPYNNRLNNLSNEISQVYQKFIEIVSQNIDKCSDIVELLNLVLELVKYEENIKLQNMNISLLDQFWKENEIKNEESVILKVLIEKISQSKVSIKQNIVKLIKEMSKSMQNQSSWLDLLVDYVDFNNYVNNVQFKEEILNLLFYIFNSQKSRLIQETQQIQNLVTVLKPYLNGNGQSKLQQSSYRLLIIVKLYNSREINQIFNRCLDEQIVQQIDSRIKNPYSQNLSQQGSQQNMKTEVDMELDKKKVQDKYVENNVVGVEAKEQKDVEVVRNVELTSMNLNPSKGQQFGFMSDMEDLQIQNIKLDHYTSAQQSSKNEKECQIERVKEQSQVDKEQFQDDNKQKTSIQKLSEKQNQHRTNCSKNDEQLGYEKVVCKKQEEQKASDHYQQKEEEMVKNIFQDGIQKDKSKVVGKKVNNYIEKDRSINLNMNRKLLDLDDQSSDEIQNQKSKEHKAHKVEYAKSNIENIKYDQDQYKSNTLQQPLQNQKSKQDLSKTQQPSMKVLKTGGNSKPKAGNTNYSKPEYLSFDELQDQPEMNYNQLCQQVVKELESDDWQVQFKGFNNLRVLMKYYDSKINVADFVGFVKKGIDNLRSGISKVSLICLVEMVIKFNKQLDHDIETIIQKIMKKSSDSSAFLQDEVYKAFYVLTQNCSEHKMTTIFQQYISQKSGHLRFNLNIIVQALINKHEDQIQIGLAEKLIVQIGQLLTDQSGDVRNYAKSNLYLIGQYFDHGFIIKSIQKTNNRNYIDKVQKILKMKNPNEDNNYLKPNIEFNTGTGQQQQKQIYQKLHSTQSIQQPINHGQQKQNQSIKQTSQQSQSDYNSSPSKSLKGSSQRVKTEVQKVERSTEFDKKEMPLDIDKLTDLLSDCENSNWKKRAESIQSISKLVDQSGSKIFLKNSSKQIPKILDCYCRMFQDSNSKVQIAALQSFNNILEQLQEPIEHNIVMFYDSLQCCLASNTSQVRNDGETIVSKFTMNLDTLLIVGPLCKTVEYGMQKAKGFLVQQLTQIVNDIYQSKPSVIQRHVIPCLSRLLDDTRHHDIKLSAVELIGELYQILGDRLLEIIPDKQTMVSKIIEDHF